MEPEITPADSLIGLIEQLTEPTVPAPIPMVPQTWGWAVLGLMLLAALGFGLWRWSRHRRANAYRRAALHLLDGAGGDPVRIAEILRRAALTAYPRGKVASLIGDEWLAFLDREAGGKGFSQGPGRIVATAPYRPADPNPALTRLAADWIRRHRGEAP
ncbi:MAG: DUF4381 domain-containing protein [Paracoccus sp. (in: a-proteobacteria)]